MKINSAHGSNEVNSRVGWDLNWYKWGSLSSLCYSAQHRARSAEIGGADQAVTAWSTALLPCCCPMTRRLMQRDSDSAVHKLWGHLQSSSIPGFTPALCLVMRMVSGCQAGRRSGGFPEGQSVSSFVLFPCNSCQDTVNISHSLGRLAWLSSSSQQCPLRLLASALATLETGLSTGRQEAASTKHSIYLPMMVYCLPTGWVRWAGNRHFLLLHKKSKLHTGAKQSSTSAQWSGSLGTSLLSRPTSRTQTPQCNQSSLSSLLRLRTM